MRRSAIKTVLLVLIPLLIIGGLAFGWWWMAVGRYPLHGDLSHDFGVMPILGDSASRTHTFVLRNATGEPVEIRAIRRGCGCTDVTASRLTVPPGEPVEIVATLTLSRSGVKHADIDLIIDGFGVQRLWVNGRGERALRITTTTTSLALAPGGTNMAMVSADVLGVGEPPELAFEAPDGVTARLEGWSQIDAGDASTARPDVWRGRIAVSLDEDAELSDGAVLAVLAQGDRVLTIPLRQELAAAGADDAGGAAANEPPAPTPGFGPSGNGSGPKREADDEWD